MPLQIGDPLPAEPLVTRGERGGRHAVAEPVHAVAASRHAAEHPVQHDVAEFVVEVLGVLPVSHQRGHHRFRRVRAVALEVPDLDRSRRRGRMVFQEAGEVPEGAPAVHLPAAQIIGLDAEHVARIDRETQGHVAARHAFDDAREALGIERRFRGNAERGHGAARASARDGRSCSPWRRAGSTRRTGRSGAPRPGRTASSSTCPRAYGSRARSGAGARPSRSRRRGRAATRGARSTPSRACRRCSPCNRTPAAAARGSRARCVAPGWSPARIRARRSSSARARRRARSCSSRPARSG